MSSPSFQFKNSRIETFIQGDASVYLILTISLFAAIVGIIDQSVITGLIIPIITIGGYLVIFKVKLLYKWLFFFIPISLSIELPGGLSTDFPAEILLWVFLVLAFFQMLWKGFTPKSANIISLLLIVHLVWLIFSSLYAENQIIAFKYSLAKSWYIIPFYMFPFYIIQKEKDVRVILQCFISGLLLGSVYFFIQHFQEGLTFLSRTNAGQPIWRNHVNYACTLVISLPMILYLFKSSRSKDKWIYVLIGCAFLIFIYFSFARIAYVCIVAGFIYTVILRLKMTRIALIVIGLSVISGTYYLSQNNRYLHLAPDYERAIMQLDFERKIVATASGEDVSTMERLHRWVAGQRMFLKNPLTGVGPGNFYNSYIPFTIFSFETYVSDNPDHSGIHNHYLMILAEQGLIGFLIWALILIIAFIYIEKLYHQSSGKKVRKLIWLVGTVISMILVINLVNDMIEVVKIGSIFFLMLAISRSIPHHSSEYFS